MLHAGHCRTLAKLQNLKGPWLCRSNIAQLDSKSILRLSGKAIEASDCRGTWGCLLTGEPRPRVQEGFGFSQSLGNSSYMQIRSLSRCSKLKPGFLSEFGVGSGLFHHVGSTMRSFSMYTPSDSVAEHWGDMRTSSRGALHPGWGAWKPEHQPFRAPKPEL